MTKTCKRVGVNIQGLWRLLRRNSGEVHTFVKFVESTLSTTLMFLHSGEMLTISSKEFSLVYVTCFTAFPIFLMARMTAAGYQVKWLPLILDVVFLVFSSASYLVVFLYVAADLRLFSEIRQELALEEQLTRLNPDISKVRLAVLALQVFILLMDAAFQIIPPIYIVYWVGRKRKQNP